ncbi:MAG: type II secretion system protein GspE, partial [Actinomycetes bacterium]
MSTGVKQHGVKQLSDILLEDGLVTEAQLTAAFDEHQRVGRPLGRVLVELGILTEAQLVASLAQQVGLEFVDLTETPVDGSAVARVSPSVCRRHTVLPIRYDEDRLVVAMADPGNVFALDDIRSFTGMEVRPVVATRDDLLA